MPARRLERVTVAVYGDPERSTLFIDLHEVVAMRARLGRAPMSVDTLAKRALAELREIVGDGFLVVVRKQGLSTEQREQLRGILA